MSENGMGKADKQMSKINMDLNELNSLSFDVDGQLQRFRNSINKIEHIEEEKIGLGKEGDELPFEEITIQEKVTRLKNGYLFLFKKLCYLNEKLEERV